MEAKVKTFKDLILWQKAHQLVLMIFKVTKNFPLDEKFGIISQMRRAAYSVPTNIVEGYSRSSQKEFSRFLSISKGSLEELRYFVILSKDLNYISSQIFTSLELQVEEVSKIMYSFSNKIKSKIT